jgi:hypothetical protein
MIARSSTGKEDRMRLNTTHHLLASTTLVLTLAAAPCLALADTGAAGSSSDPAAANYGRAGGPDFSTAQPPRTPPQPLVNAYETTKGHVEKAYEESKQFLIDSAHGRASQKQAGEDRALQQGEVETRPPVGVYGRAGVPTYWSTAQPAEPPRVLTQSYEKTKGYVKHAYEKTKEFLTPSPRHPTSEQATQLNGA